MTQFFQTDDGARISYSDEGNGLPVLCLAGLTRTMADFDYVAPHLPDCRLIRMDYRGRGQSDWTGAATYTVPREGRDAIQLLDHLGVARAAVLGTSRGGIIGMMLAAIAPERLAGLCLNDVGPVIGQQGLDRIFDYVGRNPRGATLAQVAETIAAVTPGFDNVPEGRWLQDAQRHFKQTGDGVRINYDPELREAFLDAFRANDLDLWPLFDACKDLPLALIRGANSDLLTGETTAEMRTRRPDMIFAEVPGRAHIPWLDEAESVAAIRAWIQSVHG